MANRPSNPNRHNRPHPRKVTLVVTVNLDPTGYGTMGTKEQAAKDIEYILKQHIPHYNPEVTIY